MEVVIPDEPTDEEQAEASAWRDVPHASPGFIKDGQQMNVYVDADMAERLSKAAAKVGVSRSELVRVAVRTYMEENNLWSLRGPKKVQS